MTPGGLRTRSVSDDRLAEPKSMSRMPSRATNQPHSRLMALDGSPGRAPKALKSRRPSAAMATTAVSSPRAQDSWCPRMMM